MAGQGHRRKAREDGAGVSAADPAPTGSLPPAGRPPDLHFDVPALESEVEILVDTWGVPHIYAAGRGDLFVAQGFNAARDRLFQIDLWRRRGLGRLAEVFGDAFIEHDRAARTFLYRGELASEWQHYGPRVEETLAAFVSGINAYVAWARELPERLPPEFALFGHLPDVWDPTDVVRIRSNGVFHNVETELERALLIRDHGPAAECLRRVLEPGRPMVTLDADLVADLDPTVLDLYRLLGHPLGAPATGVSGSRSGGSNNWVVSGDRTRTGRPILANDPHRAVGVPALRYIAHLVCPGLDAIGGGEPSLPGISIGHNGQVAFGMTIFPMDQEDLYIYDTSPEDPDLYWHDGAWQRMDTMFEQIGVLDSDPVGVSLRFTRHGPVVWQDAGRNRAVAIRACWLEPGMAPYLGSLAYLGAQDCEQFEGALQHWGSPGENLVFAGTDGQIGWHAAGFLPRRPNWDGTVPVPGDGRFEWNGRHSVDDLPRERNPARGWIATANECNLPAGFDNDATTVTWDWYPDTRRRRLETLLEGIQDLTVEDCMHMQRDHYSPVAGEVIATLTRLEPDSSPLGRAIEMLATWDGFQSPESAPAALFEIWFGHHLRPRLRAEFLRRGGVPEANVDAMLPRLMPEESSWSDPRVDLDLIRQLVTGSAADLDCWHEIVRGTLAGALEEMAELRGPDVRRWAWGELHTMVLKHPLHDLLDEERPEWMTLGPIARAGSGDTVDATTYDSAFREVVGASFRVIIDVGDWDRSVATNSPGQSGDPRAVHYADLLAASADDPYFPLLYTRDAVLEHTQQRIVLAP